MNSRPTKPTLKPTLKHTVQCGCGSPVDHLITMIYSPDVSYGDAFFMYAELNHYLPWYKRLVLAWKYIRGTNNKNCHHTETYITNEQEVVKMRDYLNEVLEHFNN